MRNFIRTTMYKRAALEVEENKFQPEIDKSMNFFFGILCSCLAFCREAVLIPSIQKLINVNYYFKLSRGPALCGPLSKSNLEQWITLIYRRLIYLEESIIGLSS